MTQTKLSFKSIWNCTKRFLGRFKPNDVLVLIVDFTVKISFMAIWYEMYHFMICNLFWQLVVFLWYVTYHKDFENSDIKAIIQNDMKCIFCALVLIYNVSSKMIWKQHFFLKKWQITYHQNDMKPTFFFKKWQIKYHQKWYKSNIFYIQILML